VTSFHSPVDLGIVMPGSVSSFSDFLHDRSNQESLPSVETSRNASSSITDASRKGTFVKKILTAALILICSIIPTFAHSQAQPGREFAIDVPNSKVEFFVGSSAGDVNGVFGTWSGRLYVATPGVPATATLNLQISASSMTTGSSIKDSMVKGPRFFSVDNYPTVSFQSTSVTTTGGSTSTSASMESRSFSNVLIIPLINPARPQKHW